MTVLLDAGALLSIERGNRELIATIKAELLAKRPATTHGGVLGQVWRDGGPRQARLARTLPSLRIEPLDEALGKRSGELLARAKLDDVIDAAIVLLARDGDIIVTSDPEDLSLLVEAADLHVDIVEV